MWLLSQLCGGMMNFNRDKNKIAVWNFCLKIYKFVLVPDMRDWYLALTVFIEKNQK